MTRKLRYLFLLLLVGASGAAFAQSGSISGTVRDKKTNEPIIGAVVEVLQAGVSRGGDVTDEDGKYTVKPLNPGQNYEVHVKFASYREIQLTNVLISPERTTYKDFSLEVQENVLGAVDVVSYVVPLIEKGGAGTTTLTSKTIQRLPTHQTTDAVSLSTSTYQQKSGAAISIGGARSNGTLYVIDGVQVNGIAGTNFPPGSIDQISVSTSLPANLGDASGGVVSITTKGPAAFNQGSVGVEHSIDGFNHNQAYFNVQGPLFKKKIDSINSKPVLGYALSATYIYDEDQNPSYYDNYVLKSDKLREIQEHPLVATVNSTGAPTLRSATEFVRTEDLETRKKKVNADYKNTRLVGTLDYQLSDNMNLRVGGNISFVKAKAYSRAFTLFAPDAMPVSYSTTGRGYIRFTQKFGKPDFNTEEGQTKKTPLISNAYYTLQADYQLTHDKQEDPNHKQDAFKYGYVGKFRNVNAQFYFPTNDSASGKTGITHLEFPIAVLYERSELNPLLANYTSQVFDFEGGIMPSQNAIAQVGGLRNGDGPPTTYGLWYNTGNSYTGYNFDNQEQFAFTVDASFDFQPKKTKHNIQFGLYYQQRAERAYSLGASSLWGAMRLLVNRQIVLDTKNPTYIVNGHHYTVEDILNGTVNFGPFDTILYNYVKQAGSQSRFDSNLRVSLNMDPNGTERINTDELDPSQFSIDMFSADEIINSGNSYASYYGYDYTGKRLNGQVNFNDWFTKKNALGDYTREIGAFRPNYMAGYIMDKFELPNYTQFQLGLRVERFDANTKVLKDPYSLYAVHTVSTSDAINNFNGGKTPDNIGSDYVVYIKNNASTDPEVIGYRNGDDWYDPYGKFIQDPSILKDLYSGGLEPQPYLQKTDHGIRANTMKDAGYDPNTSFTDYKPQVNAMPRISFTFPIADQSMFYAHYDVIVQRPKSVGEIFASPADYYYINQNSNSTIPNPDLKPEKTFDYELGFQQVLTKNSAVTLSGFYKERKDMIQVREYLFAWPNTYSTFGNRDFSTTKGFSLKYDLRRMNHLELQLSYTLQFAEGTGSSSTSSGGVAGLLSQLVGAQLPNLRFAFPLDNDSRHVLNADIDYRFDDGEGPLVGKRHILENAGLNLVFRARSGEPYTNRDQPNSPIIKGGIQGSRLPWHYMMDARIDKSFQLAVGKKPVEGSFRKQSRLGLTAFIYIQNLLNTKDVLSVYPYTNRPDDDGYLNTPQGELNASIQVDPEAYKDLYRLGNQNPNLVNNPRRVNLGISLDF